MESEQQLSSFLDKLAKKLHYEDHQIEITPYHTGVNFTSQLLLPLLTAPGKPDLKLFGKRNILNRELKSLIRFDLYHIENLFYSEFVPIYKRLEDTYNIPEEGRLLVPKYYGASLDNLSEILLFENLAERGFKSFKEFASARMNWDYASKSVRQLAIFHSLSIAYAEKYPEEFERITKNMKDGFPARDLQQYIDYCKALCISVCHEDNREKLKNFIIKNVNEETFDKFSKFERRPGLIHADFRPHNTMYKINEDGSLQIIIIDYQTMQRGNPLIDLMHFIFSGCCGKLLDHYYSTLAAALLRLNVIPEKVYSKEHFDSDVELFLPYGLVLAVLVLPTATVDESKISDTNDFLNGENYSQDSNPTLAQKLNDAVEDFIRMGVL